MLLKSSCLTLNYHHEQINKKKKKGRGCGKHFKRVYQGVCNNLLQEIRINVENYISSNLYNETFSESSEEKCVAFESMALSLIVHKIFIKNCSTVLQAFSSRSVSLHPLFPFS